MMTDPDIQMLMMQYRLLKNDMKWIKYLCGLNFGLLTALISLYMAAPR